MQKLSKVLVSTLAVIAASACSTAPYSAEPSTAVPVAAEQAASHAVDGLWRHDKLVASTGQDIPLSGVFILHDGIFIQQAIMDTPTAKNSQAMAHAGPYVKTDKGVNLTAEQTISLATEAGEAPLSFTPNTKHVLRAENTGNNLTLTFGSGTVQTFTRIPASEIKFYRFPNGRLALTNDRFVLVAGDQSGVVSGYGQYRLSGNSISFLAERWAEATPAKADITIDKTVSATLDGTSLRLADGRRFSIVE